MQSVVGRPYAPSNMGTSSGELWLQKHDVAFARSQHRKSTRRRILALLMLCESGGFSLGCGYPNQSEEVVCGERAAAYSKGNLATCTDDRTCPSGTICGKPVGSQNTADSGGLFCIAAVFPEINESDLISGLNVQEIGLQREQAAAGRAVYELTVPPDAHAVACSLFVARPVVRGGRGGRIVNAPAAIYRSHVFELDGADSSEARTLSFALSDLSETASSDDCPQSALSSTFGGDGHYPVVSTLNVGCIAYGSTEAVAATRLRNVALTDLPESQLILTSCVQEEGTEHRGRLCMAPDTIGRCSAGSCDPSDAGNSATGQGGTNGEGLSDSGSLASADEGTLPIPESACDRCTEGRLCALNSYFIGRCVGSNCAQVTVGNWEPPLVISNCAAPITEENANTDGLNCYDSQLEGYGTCYASGCRTRCATTAHCAPEYGLDTTTAHVCAHRQRGDNLPSYLGLCLPGAWFADLSTAGALNADGADSCEDIEISPIASKSTLTAARKDFCIDAVSEGEGEGAFSCD